MGFWNKLTNSIKNPSFIKEVYNESNGRAFKYLFLMFTLVFLIVAIPAIIKGFSGISMFKADFAQKVPDFRLENGELHFSGKQPYIQEENNFAIIVDTTGGTKEEALNKYQQGVLLTKTNMIQKQLGKTTTYNLSDLKSLKLDKKVVVDSIPFLKLFIFIIAFLAYIFFIIRKIIGLLLFAALAQVIAKRKDLVNYSKGINIAIYASTLATFLQGIMMLSAPTFPFFFVIYFLIVFMYMALGIRAIERE